MIKEGTLIIFFNQFAILWKCLCVNERKRTNLRRNAFNVAQAFFILFCFIHQPARRVFNNTLYSLFHKISYHKKVDIFCFSPTSIEDIIFSVLLFLRKCGGGSAMKSKRKKLNEQPLIHLEH